MRLGRSTLPIVICMLVLLPLSAYALVQAAHAFTPTATWAIAYPTDTSNSLKIIFNPGQPVRIHWIAGGAITLKVSSGSYSNSWDESASSGYVEIIPPSPGLYLISITGGPDMFFNVGLGFFVTPEFPLGALMAIGSSFAAFGVFGAIKLKRAKTKNLAP